MEQARRCGIGGHLRSHHIVLGTQVCRAVVARLRLGSQYNLSVAVSVSRAVVGIVGIIDSTRIEGKGTAVETSLQTARGGTARGFVRRALQIAIERADNTNFITCIPGK